MSVTIMGGFDKKISSASDLEAAERMAKLGRVPDAIALRWLAVGMPLHAHAHAKGASPKGAAYVLSQLSTGGAPEKNIGVWAERVQALHALVGMLADAGACPAPAPIPAWADPVVLAREKKARSEERKAAKAKAEAEALRSESIEHAATIDAEDTPVSITSDEDTLESAIRMIVVHADDLSSEQIAVLMQVLMPKVRAAMDA